MLKKGLVKEHYTLDDLVKEINDNNIDKYIFEFSPMYFNCIDYLLEEDEDLMEHMIKHFNKVNQDDIEWDDSAKEYQVFMDFNSLPFKVIKTTNFGNEVELLLKTSKPMTLFELLNLIDSEDYCWLGGSNNIKEQLDILFDSLNII